MADAGGAREPTAGALAPQRRPWSVGLGTFLLVPYFITLGVGGAKLAAHNLEELRNGYDMGGFNSLGVLIGFVAVAVALVDIALIGLAAFGRLWAAGFLAILAVPTAWIEIYSASIYLDGGYPPWGSAWRMGLGFALHVPLLVIGVVLLFLPPSWVWFLRR